MTGLSYSRHQGEERECYQLSSCVCVVCDVRECVLVGCVSGVVLRIVVSNVFPIPLPLPPTTGPVTHLDLSLYHK